MLETLARLAQHLTTTLSPDELGDRIVGAARDLFGPVVARLWLVTGEGEHVALHATAGAPAAAGDTRLSLASPLVAEVAAAAAPISIADVARDPRTRDVPALRCEGVVSLAVAPLRAGDRPVGALSVGWAEAHAPAPEELDLLRSLADFAAPAVNNARLFADEQARRAYLATVLEINKKIGRLTPTDALLASIAEEAARLVGVDNVGFRLLEGDDLVLAGLAGLAGETMLRPRLKVGESLSGKVVAAGRTLAIEIETAQDLVPEHLAADRRLGYTWFLGVPLQLGDRTIGVLTFRARRAFTPREVELAEVFAGQAAIALEHARLQAATSRRLEETRALLEVVEILNSTLDSKRLFKRVAIKIAQVCRVDRCSLELWAGDQVTPLMSQYADGRRAPDLWEAFQRIGARRLREVPANVRAIETRRPVVIEDTAATDLLPRDWVDVFGMKASLVVPMIRQDQVIGVMTLDRCDQATRFEAWQIDLAATIAGQLALSLENTRLYAEAQERLRETTTLLNVGRILAERGATQELMRRVAREVARALGADMVGAYFADAGTRQLVPLCGYRVPRALLSTFMSRPIVPERMPLLLPAWREGHPVASPDPQNDPRFDAEWGRGLPPHSVLFASASAHREPIGALFAVWWRTGREFQPAELRLIEAIAAQVGLAIENAELARRTQRKLHETETLLSVSRALSTTLDREALMRHFLARVVAAVDADCAGVWLRESGGEWLEPVADERVPEERREGLRRVRLSLLRHGYCVEAARARRPVATRRIGDERRDADPLGAALAHRSQLFVPIVVKEQILGGFGLIWFEQAREFSEDELALMEAVANQAAVALEHARLFAQNHRQVEELSVLHDLSRAVTGQLDRAALLDAIRAHVGRVLDDRNIVVALRDAEPGGVEIALRITDGAEDRQPPLRYARSVGLMSVVLATGRAIRTSDYLGECARRGVDPVGFSAHLTHWMGVPMAAGEDVLGVIVLRGNARPFGEADERLLANIGHLAALALRSAGLFEERARAYGALAAAQDQLVRTEKLRALGEMASGIAHDFNNLLASILGRAQLLLQRVQSPQLRQWLQVIEQASLDGAQTVRRLQEFTRIRRDIPFVRVDLNDVIRGALEITQSRWRDEAQSRSVVIEVCPVLGALPPIAGDAAELREAFTNLILNAIDAMPDGGVLTVTTAAGGDGEVVASIADSGVGIPEGVRERIFDPFFTTKGLQGTGLGLAMTYGILARHNARIEVDSAEGRGTTFRLTFRAAGDVDARTQSEPAAAARTAASSLRCLVVDDEVPVGAMLGDVLESGGHRAVVLTDGGEAIARFGAEAFDVVFTDLAMPRVSGWQVARAIKEMAPAVPVFLVTGFGVELSAEERRAHGVDAVLVKPLKIQEILDTVALIAPRRVQPT